MEFLYHISLDAGIRLAKKYGADENIVKIGISLMDCKLPEASLLGTPEQHNQCHLMQQRELNFKLNEKHNILSLDFAKEELEPYYEFFQKAINKAQSKDNTSA